MKQLCTLLVVIAFSQISLGQIQIGQDIDGEAAGDRSGRSVSLSADGSRVAIGAPDNNGNGSIAGHVRIYEYLNGSWTQLGGDIDGEAAGDFSGNSVSLSADGDTVAIGARRNAGNGVGAFGHVRIYEYSGGSWTQLGADIDGEAAGDFSGYSVSLSADGSRVAIGAPYNDGNGTYAGHVRIYEYSNGSWTQLGSDIDGEAAGDFSGYSVSLSADGSRVAIGAYSNNGNGQDAGHTRVYETTPCFTTYSTITRYSCGVFVAPSGQTLNQSGQYKDTITNSVGCDSILTINFYLVEDIYGKTQVCLVTADSATGLFNRIVWEKPTDKSFIDSFFVARETSTNNFQIIGGVHRDSLSVYEDNISIPSATSYKYKITIKDTCGNFRPYGKYHSTIHLQYFGNGIFQWTPYEIEGVTNPIANYNFYRDDLGTGNFQLLISLPGGNTSLTDPDFNLYPNARYRMEVVYNGGVTCSPSQVQMGTSELIQQSVYSKSYSNIVSFGQSSLQEDSFAWKVYPNPTRGKLRISLPIDEGVVKLYNLQGTLLIEQGVDSEEMELNLFGLASGAYIVRLELDHIITQKMVNILE